MKIIKTTTQVELGRASAEIFRKEIIDKPDFTMGLATGTSPITLYDELANLCEAGKLDFSHVGSYNLDEYVGLGGDDPQSYRWFMDHYLFSRININRANTHVPNGCAEDLEAECARYDKLIEDFGFADLQLLGIGVNGHVAFNEPSHMFSRNTSIIELSESTCVSNSRLFEELEDVPRHAISMSIRHIMGAKKILLIGNASKRDIIDEAINGDITPQIPASCLQMHPDVTIITSDE